MLFNSIEYLLFLPIVFAIYWLSGRWKSGRILQNAVLVVASFVFYGWISPKFCILIALTTVSTYVGGLFSGGKNAKTALWVVIVFNLLILAYFKYCDFFIVSFSQALSLLGVKQTISTLNVALPIGISFYTFTALSYSIDVYQKKTPVLRDFISYCAYVSFFPQLLSGPIGRSTTILPEYLTKREFDYSCAADGLRQMLWGFFKKVAIADSFAVFVDKTWATYSVQSASTLLLAAVLFTIQIYCDFSGYSDIAIGTAKLFNIKLGKNFDSPYFSLNIADFWRRWHISLTSWFRDYIYIPLGGNRTTIAKHIRNIMVVFLVSGLWHGANWTFIVWGLYHAALFIPLRLAKKRKSALCIAPDNKVYSSIRASIQMAGTFVLVMIGWIIFRSESVFQSFDFIGRMLDIEAFNAFPRFFLQGDIRLVSFLTVFCFMIEWLNRKNSNPLDFSKRLAKPIRYALYFVLAMCVFWFYKDANAFIYAQF